MSKEFTPATMYYDKDIDEKTILSKKIAVLGYGSQGHAHSQNLKDSGADIKVALRAGSKSKERAIAAGLECMSVEEAVQWADVVMILVPDTTHKDVYDKQIAPYIRAGQYLGFGHGFSIHYGEIKPPADVNTFIVAPKGPGHLVRSEYKKGRGVPALYAVGQNPSGDTTQVSMGYAKLIGAGTAGILETTFKDETETDLFGEQAVLCGGTSALIKAGFETLVEAGYKPELAYFECLHELKLIVDLIYQGGIADMRFSISDTARYGDVTAGPRVITDATKKAMKEILDDIQSGKFAKEWIEENRIHNQKNLKRMLKEDDQHQLEVTGRRLRGLMSWIDQDKLINTNEREANLVSTK